MTQESQKSNNVLIIIAIIGVVGTIVASTIGAIGSYNTEKLRQEAELTRIALVSSPVQGGATQIVSQSPVLTSAPSNSSDKISPIDNSSVKYGNILFKDDFESGQKADWSFNGFWKIVKDEDGNSVLQREGAQGANAVVGYADWERYVIKTRVKVINYGTGAYNGAFSIGFRSNCHEVCPEYSWGFQKTFQNFGRETTGWKGFMVSDFNLPLNTWLELQVEVGDTLRGFVNGEQFYEVTDDSPLLKGNIRLIVNENAKVWFDDVQIVEMLP